MGFFSNIFKRKRGGTFFGNLLRGGASALSGGLLGQGNDLARWEQEQANNEAQQHFQAQQEQLQKNRAFQIGQGIGKPFSSQTLPLLKQAEKDVAKSWIQKNWPILTSLVLGSIVAIYVIVKLATRKRSKLV